MHEYLILSVLQAAKDLTAAINDLLNAAKPYSEEPRQNLLGAASKIGDASHEILKYIGNPDIDQDFQVCGLKFVISVVTSSLIRILRTL